MGLIFNNKFKKETIRENYDEIAWKYDEKIFAYEYPDPKKCADIVNSLGLSKDSLIFDMGWGTGLVGLYLAENGFTNIDGVDASPGMLEEAKVKKVYSLLEELLF